MSEKQRELALRTESGDETVECLGRVFESDESRREHFLQRLKEKLQDEVFRNQPGFPAGSDEDILRLSDPPYYTACPNPFLEEVTATVSVADEVTAVEPFVADVSVGKNEAIYNAHSYHTKVPHLAIQQYLAHYTSPGDLVLDLFCGTGMTGVACSEMEEQRHAILIDLSPAATNIAYNYSAEKSRALVSRAAKKAVDMLEEKHGWMYKTRHTGWPSSDRSHRRLGSENPGKSDVLGDIRFVIWSDVFSCSECGGEIFFWDAAASDQSAGLLDSFACPHCSADVTKRNLERVWDNQYDAAIGQPVRFARRVPALIQYSVGKKTFHKIPDQYDLELIAKTDRMPISDWFPTVALHDGDKTSDPKSVGVTHAHHFYTRRNLAVLASMWGYATSSDLSVRPALEFLFTSTMAWATRMNRLLVSNFFKKRGGVIGQTLSGTLYVSSVSIETNPIYRFSLRQKSATNTSSSRRVFVSTQSATALNNIPDASIDYVFTDPPFGHNLVYSDLNFLWESWLGSRTQATCEAIVSSSQKKSLADYEQLMTDAFREVHRVLKPGSWVTVEFHNSKNSVWRAIQQAIGLSGLIVANVSVLNKTHGTFNQVTAAGAVKKDLAISAYKPSQELEVAFAVEAASPESAWRFTREHLSKLPIVSGRGEELETVAERMPQMLLDRMIAFHVQRGVAVPLSGPEYLRGLPQRFPERDGMYFLPEQVATYDRRRTSVSALKQQSLFVVDEATAIQWVRRTLHGRPQGFQELQPQFMRELSSWARHEETVELSLILSQSFLHYDGRGPVPSQVHSYLSSNFKDLRNLDKEDPRLKEKAADRWYVPDPNKQADLDQLRDRALLKEFEEYKTSTQRKLKVFRTEAVRAGFKSAWQARDYGTIVKAAEKLPSDVLQEDATLLMYYDNALTRMGGD